MSKFISISLESVSSCGLVTRSRPILLALAAVALIAAFAQSDQSARVALLTVALALGVAYFFTRSGVITIRSNGGEGIMVPAKGMGRENIVSFLEAVMAAKLRFIGKSGA